MKWSSIRELSFSKLLFMHFINETSTLNTFGQIANKILYMGELFNESLLHAFSFNGSFL